MSKSEMIEDKMFVREMVEYDISPKHFIWE